MLTTRQRYKQVKDKIKKDISELDENGREIVDISISDSDSLLSPYHPDGKTIIDESMANIIDNAMKSTTHTKDVHLRIKCEKYTKDKETKYKNAIINYYTNEFADKERRLHNNTIITITLFILAIISFTILYFIQKIQLPWFILEIVDIVAWVFSWEVVDMIFFQRRLIKFEQYRDLKIIYAKITFRTLSKDFE